MNCYVCEDEIVADNSTEEHIIINAAGGKLKSRNLMCRKCNSTFGENIDSALAKQLNTLSNMIMVKRHRGQAQPVLGINESNGEKYLLDINGSATLYKPLINENINENKIQLSVSARSEKELKEILTGKAKKYPALNVQEAMKLAQWHSEKFDKPLRVEVEIGGVDILRAVCKCAVNFYVYKTGISLNIKHLVPYLKGEENKNVAWMHYENSLYDLKTDECSHIIHLIGNPENKTLYCYVDYFNTYKYIVLLNSDYTGDKIEETYCFDLINVLQIQKRVNIDYSRSKLLDFFENKNLNSFPEVEKALKHAIDLGQKRKQDAQNSNSLFEFLKNEAQNSFNKYPKEKFITKEMRDESVNDLIGKFMNNFLNS